MTTLELINNIENKKVSKEIFGFYKKNKNKKAKVVALCYYEKLTAELKSLVVEDLVDAIKSMRLQKEILTVSSLIVNLSI